MIAATLALPLAAQNWVGFADEAMPLGPTPYDRAGVPANAAGEAMVRLDGWEHGGWGTTLPRSRTIMGIKFLVRNTTAFNQPLTIRIWPESRAVGKDHEPDLAYGGPTLFATPTIAALSAGYRQVVVNGGIIVPCQNHGDIFVSFGFAANDGLGIAFVDSVIPTRDVPGGAYVARTPFGYPGLVKPSHRLNVIGGAVTYVATPGQFWVDVAQSDELVSGVGGTITSQTSYPNSGSGQGTTDFLSGSNPWCGTGAPPGTRAPAPADSVTMTARCLPLAGNPVYFAVATGPLLPCSTELWHAFGLTTGAVCVNPSNVILDSIAILFAGQATVTYGPIPLAASGLGITHQAFVYDTATATFHAGPCDHQDLQ